MKNFDDELKDAFARREAPAGFSQRVMARVALEQQAREQQARERQKVVPIRVKRWSAVAAAAAVLITGGIFEKRRIEGEQAKQKVFLALRITEEKLAIAGRRVEELNQRTMER